MRGNARGTASPPAVLQATRRIFLFCPYVGCLGCQERRAQRSARVAIVGGVRSAVEASAPVGVDEEQELLGRQRDAATAAAHAKLVPEPAARHEHLPRQRAAHGSKHNAASRQVRAHENAHEQANKEAYERVQPGVNAWEVQRGSPHSTDTVASDTAGARA